MFTKEPRNISYVVSISFHVVVALIFLFVKMSDERVAEEYLLVGFGSGSGVGSPGVLKEEIKSDEQKIAEEKIVEKKNELKKVELPKAVHADESNVIRRVDKKKENTPKADEKSNIKPLTEGMEKSGSGRDSGFGFELDFGGKGMRRIYSYSLPEYPEGVAKEIDVKLRFTIMPDGTVGKIFPLIKADARLEATAINSLRQWRFEPLPPNVKQIEQTVVIIFPYRLQ
ncbi:MAG: TonB family protein [Bacteroidota bacterium]